jgi:hypothetical protein
MRQSTLGLATQFNGRIDRVEIRFAVWAKPEGKTRAPVKEL